VLGALSIAFSGILFRLAEVSPSTAAVYRCAFALPALALLAARERRRYGPRTARQQRLALLAGVFFAFDLTFWHHTIDAVGAGLGTVLGNTQVVIVGLLGWAVLGERPDRTVSVAVPVVVLGLVLISGVIGADAYGENPPLGVLFGVLTALAYAGFLLVLRQGNRDFRRPAGPLLDATFSAGVVAALLGIAVGDLDVTPGWPALGWLVALALSAQVVGWLLISVSLARLQAVVTSVVLMIQPVAAVILGMVLLDEAPSALQLVGIAVILAGVAAVTVRRQPARPPPSPIDSAPLEPVGTTEASRA
jgi:drug/metabolite transporter (DMT)-like permease